MYKNVILGGTFDHFHIGHKKLLTVAFKVGAKVTLGIADENLYKNKFLATTIEHFPKRKKSVSEFLMKNDWDSRATLVPISDIFGQSIVDPNFDAIIASDATYRNCLNVNLIRKKRGFSSLNIIKVKDVLGEDGKLVTSERIRYGEIDREGHNYQTIFNKKERLLLPQDLRTELKKPLGRVIEGREDELKETAKEIKKSVSPTTTLMIAVGDIVAMSLDQIGFTPQIRIIDFRSRRKDLYAGHAKEESVTPNAPGTINSSVTKAFQSSLKKYFQTKKQQTIIIKGEEDLVTLPAILLAPLQSIVVYGQMDLGVVAVSVTEQKKREIETILKRFQ